MPPALGPSTTEPPSDADSSSEIPWLQPYPDHLLEQPASTELEPGAAVVARETIELAYLGAMSPRDPDPARRARLVGQGDRRAARHDGDLGEQRPPAGARRCGRACRRARATGARRRI
jgi:hypothetical protein